MPVKFKNYLVIGVWAFNSRASKFGENASGYFLDALDHYGDLIKGSDQVIIAGDFNNSPQWDKPGHRNNFELINESLNALELYSSYHQISGELFSQELMATHFHQRNSKKSFHIDYVYCSKESVLTTEIEDFGKWSEFSDHVPLLVNVKN